MSKKREKEELGLSLKCLLIAKPASLRPLIIRYTCHPSSPFTRNLDPSMRYPLATDPKPCSWCAGIERTRDICLIRLFHSPRCMVSLTPCSTPAKNYFRLAHKIFIHRPKCLSAPQPSLHCAIEYLLYEIDLVTSYERRFRRSWDFIN